MSNAEWLHSVEPMVLEGRINVPYTWDIGETGTQFFTALRDMQEIWGTRCEQCEITFIPPRNRCGQCFQPISEWVQLGTEGVVESYTVTHYGNEVLPDAPPVIYALIKLDGADTALLHIIRAENPVALKTGARVRAVFAKNPQGNIMDITHFKLL